MVKRFLTVLQHEARTLHEAAYLLGFFALSSHVLALIRDRLLAHSFGAGTTLDIYYAAFRIPDLLFVSIASLVSFSVLIPFLVDRLEQSHEEARAFIDSIFTFFTLVMIGTSIALFFAMPFLIPILFPGFNETSSETLVMLARILLLQPLFLGLSNLFASVTQVHRKFVLYAVSPLLYNIGIIVGILVFYPQLGMAGLGAGVVLGALLHLVVQIPFIINRGFFPRLALPFSFSEINHVLLLSIPRTIALSAQQIALLVLLTMASFMSAGSIAVFNLSFNIYNVPLAIIGASYSVAAFPTLARLFTNEERETFVRHIAVAARHIIFWSVPALVLFIVLRAQIVRVILGSGEFSWADTRLTAAALALFSFSIAAHGLILLFVRGYYAAGKTKKPLIINVMSAILIVGITAALVKIFPAVPEWQYFIEALLRVGDVPGTHILMLPLGYSIAMLITIVVFWFAFKHDFRDFSPTFLHSLFQVLASSIAMGFVAHVCLDVFDDIFDINTLIGIFMQGLLSGIIGVVAGIALLRLLGNKEIIAVGETFHKRFWRQTPIASDEGEL